MGYLVVLVSLLWSGVCAAQILNPGFEEIYPSTPWDLPSDWDPTGSSSFYCYSANSSFWQADGYLSAYVGSIGGIDIAEGEFGGFSQYWPPVDLTDVDGIIFDVMLLASDDGGWGPFEASLIVTSLTDWTSATVWRMSGEGLYLDQIADVSAFTGPCMIELRLTATASGRYNAEYMSFWDNFGFCDLPTSLAADITLEPDPLVLGFQCNWWNQGRWVTCYIEPVEGFDATEIDGSTVCLNGVQAYTGWEWWARPAANRMNLTDRDRDGIPERVVRFARADIEAIVEGPETPVMVYGLLLDGTAFQGTAVIHVINKGPWKPPCHWKPWCPPMRWRFCPPYSPNPWGKNK